MRGTLIAAIVTGLFVVVAAVLSSPHWFQYFFPEQYLEQEHIESTKSERSNSTSISKSNEDDGREGKEPKTTGSIILSKIQITPKQFSIPSYIYFEVSNNGTRIINNLNISLDLGKSSFEAFDYTKRINLNIKIDSVDHGFINLICPVIMPNESVEVYALTSIPVFKSILISADNLEYSKEYTFADYLMSETISDQNGWAIFLQALLALFILILSIYLTNVLLVYLNRHFKLKY